MLRSSVLFLFAILAASDDYQCDCLIQITMSICCIDFPSFRMNLTLICTIRLLLRLMLLVRILPIIMIMIAILILISITILLFILVFS